MGLYLMIWDDVQSASTVVLRSHPHVYRIRFDFYEKQQIFFSILHPPPLTPTALHPSPPPASPTRTPTPPPFTPTTHLANDGKIVLQKCRQGLVFTCESGTLW